ncbi:MAG: PEP-CTERM sorting domain-containing protein [Nitrosospira sp.]
MPEPKTYAMLLAGLGWVGLGLIGFMARRCHASEKLCSIR